MTRIIYIDDVPTEITSCAKCPANAAGICQLTDKRVGDGEDVDMDCELETTGEAKLEPMV